MTSPHWCSQTCENSGVLMLARIAAVLGYMCGPTASGMQSFMCYVTQPHTDSTCNQLDSSLSGEDALQRGAPTDMHESGTVQTPPNMRGRPGGTSWT